MRESWEERRAGPVCSVAARYSNPLGCDLSPMSFGSKRLKSPRPLNLFGPGRKATAAERERGEEERERDEMAEEVSTVERTRGLHLGNLEIMLSTNSPQLNSSCYQSCC